MNEQLDAINEALAPYLGPRTSPQDAVNALLVDLAGWCEVNGLRMEIPLVVAEVASV